MAQSSSRYAGRDLYDGKPAKEEKVLGSYNGMADTLTVFIDGMKQKRNFKMEWFDL